MIKGKFLKGRKMNEIGFDSDKYLKIQGEKIKELAGDKQNSSKYDVSETEADDADEETQALHDQETGRSVPLHFDPAPSRYCNRGMVCFPVRIWSHAYDLCGKANPRTMWLWESMRSFSKAFPSCYNF